MKSHEYGLVSLLLKGVSHFITKLIEAFTIHYKKIQRQHCYWPILNVQHISCNTGSCALPDMHAFALGYHAYKALLPISQLCITKHLHVSVVF